MQCTGQALIVWRDGAHSYPRPPLSHRGGVAPSTLRDRLRAWAPVTEQVEEVHDAHTAAVEVAATGAAPLSQQ